MINCGLLPAKAQGECHRDGSRAERRPHDADQGHRRTLPAATHRVPPQAAARLPGTVTQSAANDSICPQSTHSPLITQYTVWPLWGIKIYGIIAKKISNWMVSGPRKPRV